MTAVGAMRTPMAPGEVLDALVEAYALEVGGEMPGRLLLALAAQSALETAQWRDCWCWNFGNMRGHGDAGTVSLQGATEVENGVEVSRPDGFAAFSSRLAGARAFVRYLCVATRPPTPNRYQAAIDAATRGDLPGFVRGLAAGGYFTADEGRYENAEEAEARWLEKLPEMHAWVEAA
jgi:hypothetical protein